MADELIERTLGDLRASAQLARRTLRDAREAAVGTLRDVSATLATPTGRAARIEFGATPVALAAAYERASDLIRTAVDAEVRALGGSRFGPDDVALLAAAFHDQWRHARQPMGEGFEPRQKTTTDTGWIERHGTDTVDIANTAYADLPADWQQENQAAATTVLDLVDLYTDAVGRAIHEEWLQHNPELAGTALGVDFADLPAAEREKNIALAVAVARALDGGPLGSDALHPELDELAAAIHAQWQESRRSSDGTIPSRPKVTTDGEWMARHHTAVVDLATTAYPDLPRDWQAENRQAAHHAVGVVRRNSVAIGRSIHQAWLSRNPWATGTELDVAFTRLIEGERDKDLAQFRTALRLLDSLGPEASQAS